MMPSTRRSLAATWLVPALVLLGLFFRAYHYLRCPAVWHDEAALLVNALQLDFQQQLGPLIWHEAAPPLFLWIERAVYLTCGDHLLMLRLVPFLASCVSLLLFVPIARRSLPDRAVPWAVFLFACAEKLSWHACEAKPYALDVLVAMIVLYLFCTRDRRSLPMQLCIFALLSPLCIFVSFPSCFVLGGLLVALLPHVWHERKRTAWLAYGGLALAVCGSFLLLYLGPMKAQKDDAIMSCWTSYFPDWSRPWSVPLWMLTSTASVVRYCISPLGEALSIFALVGGILFWRSGQRSLVVQLVLPGFLALIGSCLHCYPFGGARVTVYLAPALALLVAAGAVPLLDWLKERGPAAFSGGLALILLPLLQSVRVAVFPWERPDTGTATHWVMKHLQTDDVVLGNDWSHSFYFRPLGSQFHEQPEMKDHLRRRVWVVYTGKMTERERIEQALDWLQGSWTVREHREFDLTTVLLLERPSLAGG
jgi:hypothetical protein